jgi:mono/diheme cytochrome c family protein
VNGTGGDLAPDLSWEGSSVRRAWLVDFLKNPNTLRPALIRRMPRFQLSENEANLLADYILSVFQTPAFVSDEIDESKLTTTEASRGKSLYYGKYACNSCHVLDAENDKGYIGPVLTQVGLRLNATWVFHWLKNAQALRPGSLEIDWNMNDDDARAITAFLMQQKSSRKPGGPK